MTGIEVAMEDHVEDGDGLAFHGPEVVAADGIAYDSPVFREIGIMRVDYGNSIECVSRYCEAERQFREGGEESSGSSKVFTRMF